MSEQLRKLADFEKVLLFLACAESGEPRNVRTMRLLFDWSEEQADAAINECVAGGFIHRPDHDILNASVLT